MKVFFTNFYTFYYFFFAYIFFCLPSTIHSCVDGVPACARAHCCNAHRGNPSLAISLSLSMLSPAVLCNLSMP